jgi:methionyl-tRNA formyltransferase
MKKVEGITKVSKTKYIKVDDQTKESPINVHSTPISSPQTKNVTKSAKQKQEKETKKEVFDSKKLNIIFMGTGIFAGKILLEIKKHADLKKLTIITQPDKKIGRKKSTIHRSLAKNPVREFAKENNINLYQPDILNEDAVQKIKNLKPDILLVSSYGKILSEEILNIPKFGSINIHASLLPKLRGASPVQNALLIGLKKTGITIMKMDKGLDTGNIIAQKEVTIKEHEKADELLMRLSQIGSELMADIMPKWLQGEIQEKPQDSTQATLCQLIDREDGHIQWTQTSEEIYNRYRALYPWPGIFSYWEESENQFIRIKFRTIHPCSKKLTSTQNDMLPGTVFIEHDQLCIKTFDSSIIVEALQPECKAVMPIYDFLNGHKSFEGSILN